MLVGVGLGGGVAQVLATRLYRQQVAKLVLIGSYGYEYAFAPNWPLPDMAKRQDPDAPKHTATDQLLTDLRATLPQGAANATFLAGSALDAYANEWNSHVGAELLFQHIRLMIPLYMNSVSSYLRTLETPTLLIWGEKDAVTPVDLLGERMAREMPNARLDSFLASATSCWMRRRAAWRNSSATSRVRHNGAAGAEHGPLRTNSFI